jgi:hypothetical protein
VQRRPPALPSILSVLRTYLLEQSVSSDRKSRRSFTLFEASSINFVIVMYSEWMHVDCRLALNNFRDYGGQHGQESEEGKEDKEGWQEEEVIVRRKPHSIRMTSEVRYAFTRHERAAASPTEYPHKETSGRTLMQMAAA